ncbi:hypothetical protein EDB92DRAFT_1817620 [Lactarius akahatsu]|uniref:Uncharacterized protein n=1 Tax=Lactarius akahatsu TaxID=416441 RepID=A0AAD4LG12_9AGAM|nr:hypothetical protein EDB92DRAFT_1817620 [Lactarius akahatsu]
MPLAPVQVLLGLKSLWLVLLTCRQLLVLASSLVVNPDPDATGVVGSGKWKGGQGRSGRLMFLSGYYIQCQYQGPYEELVKSTSTSKGPKNKDAEVGSLGKLLNGMVEEEFD